MNQFPHQARPQAGYSAGANGQQTPAPAQPAPARPSFGKLLLVGAAVAVGGYLLYREVEKSRDAGRDEEELEHLRAQLAVERARAQQQALLAAPAQVARPALPYPPPGGGMSPEMWAEINGGGY